MGRNYQVFERRTEKVVTTLEPTVHRALVTATHAGDPSEKPMSMSNYLRRLVMKDLVDKGLLTDAMVLELV